MKWIRTRRDRQADEILVKPLDIPSLIELITKRLATGNRSKTRVLESVATILERECGATIQDWLLRVEDDKELTRIPLSFDERTGHLPQLLRDLVSRLRKRQKLEAGRDDSDCAWQHGRLRHSQGYWAAMLVEESRMLQVSIFQTLQSRLTSIDFSLVLMDEMCIADEVDSQLTKPCVGTAPKQAPEPRPECARVACCQDATPRRPCGDGWF